MKRHLRTQDLTVNGFHDPSVSLPVSPAIGDAWIASATGNGWTVDKIYEWTGTVWVERDVKDGYFCRSSSDDTLYRKAAGTWKLLADSAYGKIGIFAKDWDRTVGSSPGIGVASTTNAPAILFDDTTKETARYSIRMPNDWDGTTNPVLRIILAPNSNQTTGSSFVFEAENRYVGNGEAFNKAVDETPKVTIPVSNSALIRAEGDIALDATKISAGDHIGIAFSRVPADASDDRNGDADVVTVWLIYKKKLMAET